jgi:DNA-binding beta-propeller fold protein YncE
MDSRVWLLAACVATSSAQHSLYLISQKAGSSIAFYTPAGEMLTAVSVGRHPHEMALSADGRYLYTTDNGTMGIEEPGTGGNTVSIVDVAARKKVGEISLGNFRRPHGIDLDPTSGRLAVTTELPDQLLLIDPAARRVLRTFDTRGKTSHMVKLGAGAKWAYVSNSNSANVSAINLETGEVTLIHTGDRPEGGVVSPDGRYFYVGNRDGNTIAEIDTRTQKLSGQIQSGKGSVRMAMTPDGKRLVYALYHENFIEVADPRAKRVVSRIAQPDHVVSLNLSRDGKLAFASAEDKDTVFVVSLPEQKVVRTIHTASGSGPDPVVEIAAR